MSWWTSAFVMHTRLVKSRPKSRLRRIVGRPLLTAARFLPFPPAQVPDDYNGSLPRIIWMYWHDSEATAPEIVRQCIQSWRDKNPGWEVRVLDAESAAAAIDISFMPPGTRIQLIADVLRMELLRQFGGVWADATCLCMRSLDEWLPPRMTTGFFAFERPGRDRPLANWFLAATVGGSLISVWALSAREYWRGSLRSNHIGPNQREDQFIHHYLFEWMIHASRRLAKLWLATPTMPADAPHYLQLMLKDEKNDIMRERARKVLSDPKVPVQKLDWRIEGGGAKLKAVLAEDPETKP
jgi:hypothetical protein